MALEKSASDAVAQVEALMAEGRHPFRFESIIQGRLGVSLISGLVGKQVMRVFVAPTGTEKGDSFTQLNGMANGVYLFAGRDGTERGVSEVFWMTREEGKQLQKKVVAWELERGLREPTLMESVRAKIKKELSAFLIGTEK
jgi:hypothetical protein